MKLMKYFYITICLVFLFMSFTPFTRAELPTVAVITTGGTIAEKIDPKTGEAVPAVSGKDLLKAVPQLAEIARIKVVKYSNIDSSQMTPELWAGLAKTVDKVLEDPLIKGAVITHGTDTMAEGSYFLKHAFFL